MKNLGLALREGLTTRLTTVGTGDRATYITTSWDDGHVLDHKLAGLLHDYGLPGTFYVAPDNVELEPRERISSRGVVELAAEFEIGGHTQTHRRLTTLSDRDAEVEIRLGKENLEQLLGRGITSFCYPGGEYRSHHVGMVSAADFSFARTVSRYVRSGCPSLESGTTAHCYRHLVDVVPVFQLALSLPYGHGTAPSRIRDIGRVSGSLYRNWDFLAMSLFDSVVAAGGIFHLWGHSWEIEANGDWGRLDRVFQHISGHRNARYVQNGMLPKLASRQG